MHMQISPWPVDFLELLWVFASSNQRGVIAKTNGVKKKLINPEIKHLIVVVCYTNFFCYSYPQVMTASD